jgi:hypothetical protein
VRKSHIWRGAKLVVTAAVASAMALAMMASPASAAPSAAASDQVTISFERLAVAPAEAHAGSPALAPQQLPLRIQVQNSTSFTFDELTLFFNRFSNPVPQRQSRFDFTTGEVEIFILANCSDINLYAVGLFIGNQLVINTGDIEPDRSRCVEDVVFEI